MIWSILCLTQPSRERFLSRLRAVLRPQIETRNDVEFVVRTFDKTFDLGTNRRIMMESAKGTYISQIDDDDLVPANYVSKIYPLLDGVDYVGFRLQLYMDGAKQVPTFHSLKYPEWSGDQNGWYRDISHLNPIKKDLALSVPMSGGGGEDQRWADKLRERKIVKTEHFIDEAMYYYLFRSNKDERVPVLSGGPSKPLVIGPRCPQCGNTATGIAGGMRNCNQCGHRWI